MRNAFVVNVTCFIVVVLASGCNPGHFRAETTLHADGTVGRAIYQPRDVLPGVTTHQDEWREFFTMQRIGPEEWFGSIHDLKDGRTGASENTPPYVAAWGTFANVAAIPDHYLKSDDKTEKTSRLLREYRRSDYVVVVKHDWSETLTEIVSLEDIRNAQQELSKLIVNIVEPTLVEALGQEYESNELIAWLKTDGDKWFSQLLYGYLELTLDGRETTPEKAEARFQKIAATYGLSSLEPDAIHKFARKIIQRTVHRKDKAPLEEEVIDAILHVVSLLPEGDSAETPPSPTAIAIKESLTHVIDDNFGGQEKLDELIAQLIRRLTGFYGPFTPAGEFHYEMSVPGSIISTNGELLDDGRVRWDFDLQEAYPFGYTMQCQSLQPAGKWQETLLGKQALTSRENMLSFALLVESDEDLLKALRACEKAGSIAPLNDYRAVIEIGEDEAAEKRIHKLWSLLQLTN